MSIPLPPITVTPGSQQSVAIADTVKLRALLVSNKSQYDLQIQGFGILGARWLTAGQELLLERQNSSEGSLTVSAYNTAQISNPQAAIVLITQYLVDEPLPKGSWPTTIPTQSVQAQVSTVTTLVNDGNAGGTQIIESKQSGSSGSNVSVLNSGDFTLQQYVAATLTTLLQVISNVANGSSNVKISDLNHTTEILGKLLVDGLSTFTGASTFNNGVSIPSGQFQLNNGVAITNILFVFVGGGTTIINHNFGVTPVFVGMTLAGNFGTPPSQPCAYYGETTMQVTVKVQTNYSAKVMIIA